VIDETPSHFAGGGNPTDTTTICDWSCFIDEAAAMPYYYNESTDVTAWELPSDVTQYLDCFKEDGVETVVQIMTGGGGSAG
jgi:hypothetical protein